MAGSNAVAGPTALIALLATALDAEPVEVDYAHDGRAASTTREYVYGGDVGGPHEDLAMRGGGRRPREERLIWQLHIEVAGPHQDPQENAARAMEICQIVEETLASPTAHDGAGVSGLKKVGTVSFKLQNFADDEARYTDITLGVLLHSVLK